jgi:hypothetical protein
MIASLIEYLRFNHFELDRAEAGDHKASTVPSDVEQLNFGVDRCPSTRLQTHFYCEPLKSLMHA